MSQIPVQRISVDKRGIARIAGSRSRVSQIVVDHRTLAPEEIVETYSHLTLADVYAALAYYYDHKNQIDAEIQEGERLYEEGLKQQQNDPKFQSFVKELNHRAGRQ
jgi:uncharacterized protein (DUF433 family)